MTLLQLKWIFSDTQRYVVLDLPKIEKCVTKNK